MHLRVNRAFWQFLALSTWGGKQETRAHLPKSIDPRNQFMILEKYCPLEGFHTLLSAFPWCFLCIMRFWEGEFICEVIRFVEGIDVRMLLFSISFVQEHGNIVEKVVLHNAPAKGLLNVVAVGGPVTSLKPHLELNYYQGELIGHFIPKPRLGLTLNVEKGGSFAREDFGLWVLNENGDNAVTIEHTQRMVTALAEHSGRLAFSLVTSPLSDRPQGIAPIFGGLREGLYVGNYGHYAQFKNEVLHVSFVSFPNFAEHPQLALEWLKPIFAGGDRAIPDDMTVAVTKYSAQYQQRGVMAGLTMVVAKKVTGDIHVCAGANTFVAVCGPDGLEEYLKEPGGEGVRVEVSARGDREKVEVRQGWRGWGTLAFPGFGSPSWRRGHLLCTCDGRFGFAWDGNTNQDMILLRYVASQEQDLFQDRRHLPTSLQ